MLITQAQNQLWSIAKLKCSQITDWRDERTNQAEELANNPILREFYNAVISSNSGAGKTRLIKEFMSRQKHEKFHDIVLVDRNAVIRLSTNSEIRNLPPTVSSEVSASINTNQPVFGDIMTHQGAVEPHIHITAPIMSTHGELVIGAVVLSVQTSDFLHKMMTSWPLKSDSAEAFLVRLAGNQALCLTELRYRKNSALKYSITVSDPTLYTTNKAGNLGVMQVADYRGVPVLRTAIKVPGTNWFMVAKTDVAEALRHQRNTILILWVLVVGSLLVIMAIVIVGWYVFKSNHYRHAYENERNIQALGKHYKALLQNASDIVILTDPTMHIVDVNDIALETYGYTRHQMVGMDYEKLVTDGERDAYHQRIIDISSERTMRFYNQHIKHSGDTFYVEGTARMISVAGASYIQLTIHDTTQRVLERKALERSEQLFREFMDHLPGLAFIEHAQGGFQYANASLCEKMGIKDGNPDELAASTDHPMYSLLHSDHNLLIQLAQQRSIMTEIQYVEDNHPKQYLLGRFLIDQEDETTLIGGIMLDITRHKLAERELHHMSLMYATLSHINEAIIRATDQTDLFELVCRAAVEQGKCTLAWIGLYDESKKHLNAVAISGGPNEYVNIALAPASGFMSDVDPFFAVLRDKHAVFANNIALEPFSPGETLLHSHGIHSAAALPIIDNGELIGVCALYQQEPEFYREQERLLLDEISFNISFALEVIDRRRQQQQLEEIIVHSPVIAFKWQVTADWPVIYTSDNIAQLGFDADYFTSHIVDYAGIIHPEDLSQVRTQWEIFSNSPNAIFEYSYRIVDQTGSVHWVEERSWIVKDSDDVPQYVLGIVMDISQQQYVEQELLESEHRYRSLFDSLHTAMIIIDPETGQIADANPAAVEFYGWNHSQLLGMYMADICANPDSYQIDEITQMAQNKRNFFRDTHRRADGKLRDVEVLSVPAILHGKTLLYSIIRDISDLVVEEEMHQRSEQRRIQSQKMETIGRLSSGIAHDFNNLLTVITGFVDIMMDMSDEDNPLFPELMEVRRASDQAASLTKQLLAFSRKQTLEKTNTDINKLVSTSQRMFTRLVGEDIKVEMNLSENPLIAYVDEGQIQQVILNLATNARDAMPNGGTLRLVTGLVTISDDDMAYGPESSTGKYVSITVADTGIGMSEETISKIFEPFYTTKELGKGTGLGLATCYGIMKQHDGWISVSSTEGIGSEFHLYVPTVVTEQAPTGKPTTAPTLPQGIGQRILLVEDEPAVQRMSMKVLQRFNYTVIPASDGEIALDIYRNDPNGFALVMTDVVMPNMDGLTLIKNILAVNPKQKVIMNSGYTDDKVDWGNIETLNIVFLHKPFTVEKLITTIYEVLGNPEFE